MSETYKTVKYLIKQLDKFPKTDPKSPLRVVSFLFRGKDRKLKPKTYPKNRKYDAYTVSGKDLYFAIDVSKEHVNKVLKKLHKLGYNAKATPTKKLKNNYTWDLPTSAEAIAMSLR